MPKYIDFDALGVGMCNPDVFENKGYAEGWNSLIKILHDAPAADVEGKRMEGIWIEQPESLNDRNDKIYRCSICGYADEQSPSAEVPYCWHCGSRMKKMFSKSKEAENAFPSN